MSVTILKNNEKKEKVNIVLNKIKQESGLDAKKYYDKIKLQTDPLLYQKSMRDEWK